MPTASTISLGCVPSITRWYSKARACSAARGICVKLWQNLPRLKHRPALTCLTSMSQIQQICKYECPRRKGSKFATWSWQSCIWWTWFSHRAASYNLKLDVGWNCKFCSFQLIACEQNWLYANLVLLGSQLDLLSEMISTPVPFSCWSVMMMRLLNKRCCKVTPNVSNWQEFSRCPDLERLQDPR